MQPEDDCPSERRKIDPWSRRCAAELTEAATAVIWSLRKSEPVCVLIQPMFLHRTLRTWRRPLSGVLALALCTWLVTFAFHLHKPSDEASGTQGTHACEVCASLAAGPAPSQAPPLQFAGRPPAPIVAQPAPVAPIPFLASYRSRAPPSV
jgi:hypothetical protein